MKKSIELQKPTSIQLATGLVISLAQAVTKGYSDMYLPERIKQYQLIAPINKKSKVKTFATGLYKRNGKNY